MKHKTLMEGNYGNNGYERALSGQAAGKKGAQLLQIPFVQHHIQHYNGQFPVWVIIELFTFGMLSRFYADLRNNCAHHDRLYFRIFPSFPAGLYELDANDRQRLFGMLLVLKTLYPDKEGWNREVFEPIQSLLIEYQSDVKLRHTGFPKNWREMLKVIEDE